MVAQCWRHHFEPVQDALAGTVGAGDAAGEHVQDGGNLPAALTSVDELAVPVDAAAAAATAVVVAAEHSTVLVVVGNVAAVDTAAVAADTAVSALRQQRQPVVPFFGLPATFAARPAVPAAAAPFLVVSYIPHVGVLLLLPEPVLYCVPLPPIVPPFLHLVSFDELHALPHAVTRHPSWMLGWLSGPKEAVARQEDEE